MCCDLYFNHTHLQFFHQLVAMDRHHIQGHLQDFLIGGGIHVTVKRDHIYEDAFTALAQEDGECFISPQCQLYF